MYDVENYSLNVMPDFPQEFECKIFCIHKYFAGMITRIYRMFHKYS